MSAPDFNIFTIRTFDGSGDQVDEAEAESPEGAVLAAKTLMNEMPVRPGRPVFTVTNNITGQVVFTGRNVGPHA